ncbi:MAG: hypothetical protein ABSG74_02580 [Candidatus Bathyarchaeia archaeon]|jgi:hypothetical protein
MSKANQNSSHDGKSDVITSSYVVKSRNLSSLLRQTTPLSVKYQERFNPVAPSIVRSIYRVVHGGDQTEVYETVGPGVVFTSFRSGSVGLACTAIVEMSLTYGEPTLLYEDKRQGYSDITAEWWPEQFLSELPKRVVVHQSMYSTETLHMREVERQAEKYLSQGNSGSCYSM